MAIATKPIFSSILAPAHHVKVMPIVLRKDRPANARGGFRIGQPDQQPFPISPPRQHHMR